MNSNILVIDDSISARELIKEILSAEGYIVHLAGTGRQGLESVKNLIPDLVLLDIHLGDMNGLEVCKEIKSEQLTQDIPIILLSGAANAEEWVKGLRLGVSDCVLKPFNTMELLVRIQAHISMSQVRKLLRQAENEIAERNLFVESLMDLSPGIIYIYDIINQKNIYSNEGIQRILGYSTEEIRSMGNQLMPMLMYPDDFEIYVRNIFPKYKDAKDEEQISHQYRMKHKNGSWRWLESTEAIYKRLPDGTPKEIFGTVHDITNKKLGEDALKNLAKNFAKLSGKDFFREVSKHIATVAGIDCVFIGELDSKKENITVHGGYFLGEWLEMSYALAHTPCEKVIEKSFCFHPHSVQSLFPDDIDLVHMKAQSYMGSPIFDKQNEAIGLIVGIHSKEMTDAESVANLFNIFIDRITAEMLRDKAEQELEVYRNHLEELVNTRTKELIAAKEHFEMVFSINPDIAAITRLTDFVVTNINEGYIKATGYKKEEIIGKPSIDIWADPKERLQFHELLNKQDYFDNLEVEFRRKDGTIFTGIISGKIFSLQDVPHLITVTRDISERKKAENKIKETQSQLIQSEKLASIGILTAGIAHEINNPINYINSSITALNSLTTELIDLLKVYDTVTPENINNKLEEIKGLKEQINLSETIEGVTILSNNIKAGAKKTADIVKSLRIFSKMDSDEQALSNINENLDSTLILLHNQYADKIEIVKNYGNLPLVKCFAGKLNQVFMNLLANAIQAINDNGTITIKTDYLKSGISNFNKECIFISIRDTGSGISSEIKNKIFEPFFTTKEIGKGTGLGLSISYGIIEQHNGKMEFKSEIGKGTEFTIYLPV